MRRPLVIFLMLMGGGAVVAGTVLPHRNRAACEQARAQNLPDAEEICARVSSGSSSGTHHSAWYWGGSSTRTTAFVGAATGGASKPSGGGSSFSGSVSRGGFGGAGGSFSGGS